jgi:hypothetical protein
MGKSRSFDYVWRKKRAILRSALFCAVFMWM